MHYNLWMRQKTNWFLLKLLLEQFRVWSNWQRDLVAFDKSSESKALFSTVNFNLLKLWNPVQSSTVTHIWLSRQLFGIMPMHASVIEHTGWICAFHLLFRILFMRFRFAVWIQRMWHCASSFRLSRKRGNFPKLKHYDWQRVISNILLRC